jgi:sugar lactone lactonase YvrE
METVKKTKGLRRYAIDMLLLTLLVIGTGATSDTYGLMTPLNPQQAEMSSISSPEVSSGQAFVNINQNYRVVKYSLNGEKTTEWTVGGIIETNGMGIGPEGEIYIAADNNRILKYSPDGEKLAEWNVEGAEDIQGITIGRSGEVLVNINQNYRVVIYSPSGEMLGELALERDTSAIAVDPNGLIVIVYSGN